MSIKLTATITCIIFILQSCIYEYFPKTGEPYENCLVIYGMITTENGPHEITIYKNQPIGKYNVDSVGRANVSLSDNLGNIIPLTEASKGRYLTPNTFAGKIGAKYKLNIVLPDGKKYESDYVELLDVPDISELKAEQIIKPATATTSADEGYQFYVSTQPGNSDQKYFKWEIDEDWEFDMPYIAYYYWDGKDLTNVSIPYQCYSQRHLSDFFISSTINSQINYISNYPLHFVSKYYKLQYGYGIRVRQYALSEFSYNFWKNVIENNNPNAINSKQQYPLVGNLKCISNPDESVYGILEASAVKVKNLQVKNLFAEHEEFSYCFLGLWVQEALPKYLIGQPPGYLSAQKSQIGYTLVFSKNCIFCEAAGGTSIRPKYWGNK